MLELLLRFDQFSFWLGIATAMLIGWLLNRIRPALRGLWDNYRKSQRSQREILRVGVEYDYRNDFIRFIQGRHLAAPLFSLNEILVPPRLLAPPPQTIPNEEGPPSDSLSKILPYMPDYPELASTYGAEKLSLVQALSRGANLALMGDAGSGKSVALVHLGSQIASLSPDAGLLAELIPFYVHAADLDLPLPEQADPLAAIQESISKAGYLSRRTASRFANLVQMAATEERFLLLLDGIDELPPTGVKHATQFVQALIAVHPSARVVAAVSADYYDGITAAGLFPVCMAAWTPSERRAFIRRWGQGWQTHINAGLWAGPSGDIQISMLYNWLDNESSALTPLELTLRAWTAFAGDGLGSRNSDSLEAYLRRLTPSAASAAAALERIAAQMALTMRPVAHRRAATLWSRGQMAEISEDSLIAGENTEATDVENKPGRVARGTVPDLITAGILIARPNDHLSFAHPVLAGYCAGRGLAALGRSAALAAQPEWSLRQLAFEFLAASTDITPVLRALESADPLLTFLLRSARWLRNIDVQTGARTYLMRHLASTFQNDAQPAYIRLRAMAALALSADPTVTALCKKLLNSADPLVRGMCALVLGYSRDEKLIPELATLLSDPSIQVRAAVCLALANIGTVQAVESIAGMLLHGDEDTQRAAAEALALVPGDGFDLLREASAVPELMVRRAAVFGLGKLGRSDAAEIIRKLQLEDGQWVVRNSAMQEINRLEQGSASIPAPFHPLHETPWLLEFASERGEGLAPGQAAEDSLFSALIKGDVEQKLAAMDRYRLAGNDAVWTVLHEHLFDPISDLQTAALQTLWHLSAQGFSTAQVQQPLPRE